MLCCQSTDSLIILLNFFITHHVRTLIKKYHIVHDPVNYLRGQSYKVKSICLHKNFVRAVLRWKLHLPESLNWYNAISPLKFSYFVQTATFNDGRRILHIPTRAWNPVSTVLITKLSKSYVNSPFFAFKIIFYITKICLR